MLQGRLGQLLPREWGQEAGMGTAVLEGGTFSFPGHLPAWGTCVCSWPRGVKAGERAGCSPDSWASWAGGTWFGFCIEESKQLGWAQYSGKSTHESRDLC